MSAFDNMKKLDEKANEEGVSALSSLEIAVWRSDSITAADELAALREAAGALKELWQYVLDNSGDDCGCEPGDYSVGIYPSGPCSHCKTKAALAALENK